MFYTVPFSDRILATLKDVMNDELRLALPFFAGCLIFARRGAATKILVALLTLAVILSFDGIIELRLGYPPWANHIPSFMRVDDATLANVLGTQARSADGLYRVRGPFNVSLMFAEFLALCMPFVLHWLFTGRSFLIRAAAAVAGLLIIVGILITQSRLGLVGTIVAVGIYVPLWAYRQWRADRTSLIGPTILFGAPFMALALIGVVFSSHTLTTRVLGGGAQQASTLARAEQRRLAIPKIVRNPIGHGLGQSGHTIGFYNQAGGLSVDNHYLTSLIDLGVVGSISFYGMFLVAARIGAGLYLTSADRETELAGPLCATFFVFLVVKSVLSQEYNHTLVFVFLAMLLALLARERKLYDPDNLAPPAPEAR